MITEDAPRPEATETADKPPHRTILFGAIDRHNFGDLLLAHCAAARAYYPPVAAGLVGADLTAYGGHLVRPLREVVTTLAEEPADLVHVGGEILTTTAWEAAVMLQRPDAARRAIATHERNSRSRRAWAVSILGTDRRVPYVVPPARLPSDWNADFRAVGGVAFDRLPVAERHEVATALQSARRVSVRDAVTRSHLARAGVAVSMEPDPAENARALFAPAIAARLRSATIADFRDRLPRYIAVQLAARWGDDATLARVARALVIAAQGRQAGIALFRAGLAPWHDDLDTLKRLAGHIAGLGAAPSVELVNSAHVFDICAVLAGAHAALSTSLHAWIVANSHGVAAHCLVTGPRDKAAAYLDTWHATPRRWRTIDEDDLLPTL